jgi:phage tail-like protein
MNKNNDWNLPVAFYFQVKFGNEEYAFKEVSGLEAEIELENIREGGVNNFEYKLPKQIKHGNLVLKRAILPLNCQLIVWVKKILEGDFDLYIYPKNIVISLLNEDSNPLYTWTCERAYPVKWNIESLDSKKNNILIETLEFAFASLKRS